MKKKRFTVRAGVLLICIFVVLSLIVMLGIAVMGKRFDTGHMPMTMIKEYFLYCYLDFDGDGLPELVVDPLGAYVRFGGPRVFKYDRDSRKVYVDGYRYMRYRPLCAGKFYYAYEAGSPDSIQYGYQEIDSQGNVIEDVSFQLAYPSPAYGEPERY